MCKIPIISEGLALFVSLVLQAQSVLFKAMYNVTKFTIRVYWTKRHSCIFYENLTMYDFCIQY